MVAARGSACYDPLVHRLALGLLAGLLAGSLSCKDGEGGPSASDYVDALGDFFDVLCECQVMAGLYPDLQTCQDVTKLAEIDQEYLSCFDAALEGYPVARTILDCATDAVRAYTSCVKAEGCPDSDTPFTCDDGEAVPGAFVCDGFPDCVAGEDEVGCPPPLTCDGGQELPSDWVCDGEADCADETDELGCPDTCESRFYLAQSACGQLPTGFEAVVEACLPSFTCNDGEEIPVLWVCDGEPDCGAGEDEAGCRVSVPGSRPAGRRARAGR